MHGTKLDEGRIDLWFRKTIGFRRINNTWQIVHEHESVPFLMDGSGLAALELDP